MSVVQRSAQVLAEMRVIGNIQSWSETWFDRMFRGRARVLKMDFVRQEFGTAPFVLVVSHRGGKNPVAEFQWTFDPALDGEKNDEVRFAHWQSATVRGTLTNAIKPQPREVSRMTTQLAAKVAASPEVLKLAEAEFEKVKHDVVKVMVEDSAEVGVILGAETRQILANFKPTPRLKKAGSRRTREEVELDEYAEEHSVDGTAIVDEVPVGELPPIGVPMIMGAAAQLMITNSVTPVARAAREFTEQSMPAGAPMNDDDAAPAVRMERETIERSPSSPDAKAPIGAQDMADGAADATIAAAPAKSAASSAKIEKTPKAHKAKKSKSKSGSPFRQIPKNGPKMSHQ